MNDPPLPKGDIGGFSKHLNPPLPPFSKRGDANKYMPRVINHFILFYKLNTQVLWQPTTMVMPQLRYQIKQAPS